LAPDLTVSIFQIAGKPCGDRDRKVRHEVKSLVSQLGAALVACFLTFAPIFAVVDAAEDLRKVTVVSFGLFGDQGVFRSEATGAAQIVASRFGGGPVVVNFNAKAVRPSKGLQQHCKRRQNR
jgi:hypothetical protein